MFKLKLKNFRGFLDEEFSFSRINILIGENSAGKSSLLKFLLAMKQSFAGRETQRESNFTFNGDDTDLGNYKEVIHNHDIRRNLAFSFEFGTDYFDFFLDYLAPLPPKGTKISKRDAENYRDARRQIVEHLNGPITTPTLIKFRLTSDLTKHSNITTHILNTSIGGLDIVFKPREGAKEEDILVVGTSPTCALHFHSARLDKTITLPEVEFEKTAFLSMVDGGSLEKQVGLLVDEEERKQVFDEIAFLLISQNYVMQQVSGMEYINPLASEPAERVYLEGDRTRSRRIGNVRELVNHMITPSTDPDFVEDLVALLSKFGIADNVYVKREGFTTELRVVLNEIDNNIRDVGFGVSLQLPIFAQALLAENTHLVRNNGIVVRKGQTLLIEQPEVHLHPRLQAKFIEMLLRLGANNTYFIETHSEHIIRMLQVLVKEGRHGLKSEDVSIHYLRKEGKTIKNSRHSINQVNGKLDPPFPKGFYDVSYDLAFQLLS